MQQLVSAGLQTIGLLSPRLGGRIAFSPDRRTLAAGTTDQRGGSNLYLIDVQGGKLISARRLAESVSALAYSPDGQTLVTGHNLGKVRAWNAAALRGD